MVDVETILADNKEGVVEGASTVMATNKALEAVIKALEEVDVGIINTQKAVAGI